MPDMDGYEVCTHLQSDEYTRYIPVLLLTAYQSDSKDVVRGLEFGALSFLTKPFDNYVLIAHVNVALRITKTEKALRESEGEMCSLLNEHKLAEKALKERINKLERFNKLTVDRELQLIELKKEINELLEKAGLPKKYSISEQMNELTKKTEIQEIYSLTLTGHFAVFTLDEHYFAGEQEV